MEEFLSKFVTTFFVESISDKTANKAIIDLIDTNKDGCFSLQELKDGMFKLLQMAKNSNMNKVLEKLQKDLLANEQGGKHICRIANCKANSWIINDDIEVCMDHYLSTGNKSARGINDNIKLDAVPTNKLMKLCKMLPQVQFSKLYFSNMQTAQHKCTEFDEIKQMLLSLSKLQELHICDCSLIGSFGGISIDGTQISKLILTGNKFVNTLGGMGMQAKLANLKELVYGENTLENEIELGFFLMCCKDIKKITLLKPNKSNNNSGKLYGTEFVKVLMKFLAPSHLSFNVDDFEIEALQDFLNILILADFWEEIDVGVVSLPTCTSRMLFATLKVVFFLTSQLKNLQKNTEA